MDRLDKNREAQDILEIKNLFGSKKWEKSDIFRPKKRSTSLDYCKPPADLTPSSTLQQGTNNIFYQPGGSILKNYREFYESDDSLPTPTDFILSRLWAEIII